VRRMDKKEKEKSIRPLLVFILGPTGVGKSEFAVGLAKKIKGEIVSCDSMQVYKGMAIMSQQPSRRLRQGVRHHLVGCLAPSKEWSAADFVEKAHRVTFDIVRRGYVPIIVGGTGLYARAFIRGLSSAPPKDEGVRRYLNRKAQRIGRERLFAELAKVDHAYAKKIHPNDLRRIIRALEVYTLTGKPFSHYHGQTRGIEDRYRTEVFVLHRKREELYNRINERVENMFDKGLVREVKRLKKRRLSRTAKAVLGYKEISGYLKGEYGLEDAKELLKRNTRRYAKRQLTWFRREKGAIWLELGSKYRQRRLLTALKEKVGSLRLTRGKGIKR